MVPVTISSISFLSIVLVSQLFRARSRPCRGGRARPCAGRSSDGRAHAPGSPQRAGAVYSFQGRLIEACSCSQTCATWRVSPAFDAWPMMLLSELGE